jgi:hypothetical protein
LLHCQDTVLDVLGELRGVWWDGGGDGEPWA